MINFADILAAIELEKQASASPIVEMITESLRVARSRGEYDGTYDSAVKVLQKFEYEINEGALC